MKTRARRWSCIALNAERYACYTTEDRHGGRYSPPQLMPRELLASRGAGHGSADQHPLPPAACIGVPSDRRFDYIVSALAFYKSLCARPSACGVHSGNSAQARPSRRERRQGCKRNFARRSAGDNPLFVKFCQAVIDDVAVELPQDRLQLRRKLARLDQYVALIHAHRIVDVQDIDGGPADRSLAD